MEQVTIKTSRPIKKLLDSYCKLHNRTIPQALEDIIYKKTGRKLPQAFTIKQIAEAWGVNPATVKRLIARNPDVPVLNRGKRGQALRAEAVEELISRMES